MKNTITFITSAKVLLLSPLLFVLSGCQKDNIAIGNNNDLATTEVVVPKVMVFESGKAFMDMFSKSLEEIQAIQSELFAGESFTSYAKHFSEVETELSLLEESDQLPATIREIEEQFGVRFEEDEDGGQEIVPAVKSPGLAAIANENGLYQIGDTLIQIVYDIAYMAKISEITDFIDLSSSPNVQTINLYERAAGAKAVTHECVRNYTFSRKDHRLRVQWEVEYINVPIPGISNAAVPVTEIYINVRHQKRGFLGAWFANNEQRIWAVGTVTHLAQSNTGNSTVFFNVNHESLNSSNLFIRVHLGERTANIPVQNWILDPSSVVHSSRDAGSGPWSCTIVN